jgi:hypothetical protein
VQSEFDKNSEKYGYTFTSNETEQYRSWKTDNWTTESAAALAAKVTKRIKPHKKLNTWATQSLLWYGNSKEYIETTPHVDIHWNYIKDQTSMLLDTYFKKLMAI